MIGVVTDIYDGALMSAMNIDTEAVLRTSEVSEKLMMLVNMT